METFVQKVSDHLKQGAKWVINTGLIAESFLLNFIREKKYELPGLTMEIKNDYDEWNSCLLTTLTYTKDGKQDIKSLVTKYVQPTRSDSLTLQISTLHHSTIQSTITYCVIFSRSEN